MKHGKRAVLMVLLALVGVQGCGSRPVLQPGAETVRVGKNDPEAGATYVGEVTSISGNGCGMYGQRGNYPDTIVVLRNTAHQMGADYAQIMTQVPPSMQFNCFFNEYRIDASLYRLTPRQASTARAITSPSTAAAVSPASLEPAPKAAMTFDDAVAYLQSQHYGYQEYSRRYLELRRQYGLE